MIFDPVEAYRRMYLIRRVELEIVRRYYPDPSNLRESPMRCPVHLSIGQEGVAVGVAMAVQQQPVYDIDDPAPPEKRRPVYHVGTNAHAYSTHRCHAHYLAWGGNLDRMIAELYGKATGCSGGRAGSMHLHDESAGFMGTSAIVGSSVSLAVGNAYAARLSGDDSHITVAFGGDAVLETGQFWESLNFAMLHKLRVLFVIEDNGLSTATPKGKRQPYAMPTVGMRWTWHEPDDVKSVFAFTRNQLEYILPAVVEFKTRRFHEHVGMARMPEFETYPDGDPLKLSYGDARVALWRNVADEVLGDIERECDASIASAFAKAEAAPWPEVA